VPASCWNCMMRADTLPPTETFFARTGFPSTLAGLRKGADTERAVSIIGVSAIGVLLKTLMG